MAVNYLIEKKKFIEKNTHRFKKHRQRHRNQLNNQFYLL
jgi:hypothetical protein